MSLYPQYKRLVKRGTVLVILLLLGGCSSITPSDNWRNNREEGPENGLFTGAAGEFVIIGPPSASADSKVAGEKAEENQQ